MIKLAAVVIPIWKNNLNSYEIISLTQSFKTLNSYPIYIITHQEVDLRDINDLALSLSVNINVILISKMHFKSIESYNKLMLSPLFYLRFLAYRYILINQLDVFVFQDELKFWVNKNYSFIGAPWLKGFSYADCISPYIGVGNGGFSLRKVSHHLRTLLKFRFITPPINTAIRAYKNTNGSISTKIFNSLLSIVFNNCFFLLNRWNKNEDIFWSRIASRNSWYTIPDIKTAARFSIEVQPARVFAENNQLPFGCHAWWKYDLNFWKPYIERYGYRIE